MFNILFLFLAYLLGSIPFSYLFGELFKHQDLRKFGSGNLGATNAFRVFGKAVGSLVMVFDVVKSGLLVFLMIHYSETFSFITIDPLYFGLASVIGHVYPVWFKFKGGKGVATSFGLLLAFDWKIALIMALIFFAIQIATRYVSVSSVLSAVAVFFLNVYLYFFSGNPMYHTIHLLIVTFVAVMIIVFKHSSNYERLKKGTENKVKWLDFLDKKKS
ncbi:MAG: glycerol-3-phosphate 1-O-acyltransferase PlsY [Candidatus Izemoplasmatales bacterium]